MSTHRAAEVNWLLLDSGPGEPAFNMALDEALLESMPRLQQPVLRFYGWTEPAATFGYFQRYADVEGGTALRPLIRRPTGGGLVPHDSDWTYSLVLPPGHAWHSLRAEDSYRRAHEWLQRAFARLNVATELALVSKRSLPGQCFAGFEKHDLLWNGKKIAGAAQRRNKLGLLIEGSVQPPPGPVRNAWQTAMIETAQEDWRVHWETLELNPALVTAAQGLAVKKYSQAGYNRKR